MPSANQPKTLSKYKSLWIVLLILLAVRLVIFAVGTRAGEGRFIANDTGGYESIAQAWMLSGQFSVSPEYLDIPETLRTPGYPAFLGFIHTLFGDGFSAVILIQMWVSLGTAAIVYKIGQKIWGEPYGVWAALLFGLEAAGLGLVFQVLTETLFTFFLALFLFAGLNWIEKPEKWAPPLLAGLWLGLAALVRPVVYYLPPLVALAALAVLWRTHNRKVAFLGAARFFLPALILIGGWQLRNLVLTGNPSFSQIAGVNMLYYRGAAVLAEHQGVSIHDARLALVGEVNPWNLANLNPEQQLSQRWQSQGFELARAYPAAALKVTLSGMANMFLGSGDGYVSGALGEQVGKEGPLGDILRLSFQDYIQRWVVERPLSLFVFILSVSLQVLLYAGVILWGWQVFKTRRISLQEVFLIGVAIYLIAISAGSETYFRFRVPVMPALAVISAAGIGYLKTRFHLHKHTR